MEFILFFYLAIFFVNNFLQIVYMREIPSICPTIFYQFIQSLAHSPFVSKDCLSALSTAKNNMMLVFFDSRNLTGFVMILRIQKYTKIYLGCDLIFFLLCRSLVNLNVWHHLFSLFLSLEKFSSRTYIILLPHLHHIYKLSTKWKFYYSQVKLPESIFQVYIFPS